MSEFIIFLATKLYVFVVVGALLTFLYVSLQQKRELIKVSIITLPLAFVLSRVVKIFIQSPRPFVDGHMVNLIPHIPDNGFPSDHALLVFTVAAIVYTQHKKIGILLFALGIFVGAGRVFAGVHHTLDIVGSFVIAVAATCIAVWMLGRFAVSFPYRRR
tara:strand:+ start:2179 stop:2655 length:477 start_codon:yes stop_codon:yes gene_type:complete